MHLAETSSPFAAFYPHLKNIDWAKPVALAVSGGGDSMALLAAVLHYRRYKNLTASLIVLTVDHALRPEAAGEAAAVHAFCKQHDIQHQTLTWTGSLPKSAIAERARDMRRELLLQACNHYETKQLVLAHTQDDVAETLMMRVRRGGLRGHASIPAKTFVADICIHRPFIKLRRDVLRQALRDEGIRWVDDPTNDDMRYERPRVRTALRSLERAGQTTEEIAHYADTMGRWRQVLAKQISSILEEACDLHGCDLQIKVSALRQCPNTVALETLRELVRFIGGDANMINRDQAARALDSLILETLVKKPFSAGRCVFSPKGKDIWILSRAIRDLPTVEISTGQSVQWDGRFVVRYSGEFDEIALISPHNNTPKVMPYTVKCEINFHPRVLDGPISYHDKAIFRSFSALLQRAGW